MHKQRDGDERHPPQGGNGHAAGRAVVRQKAKPDKRKRKGAEDYGREQTAHMNALFAWAKTVLENMGLMAELQQATTREELHDIELDEDDPELIVAIRDALRPGSGKQRAKHFERLNESQLRAILRNRFAHFKKLEMEKLQERVEQHDAAEEQREKREENVKFYGEFKQYKALDHGGVFVELTEEDKTQQFGSGPVTEWVQIARTRIDLLGVSRSKQDDNWGVYVKLVNMDGRITKLAVPRSIINDKQGSIAGRLAGLGVDVVKDQREQLPDFLLTTTEVTEDDMVRDLMRFLAVPMTGWWQLNNGRWVFVLPHTTKIPADLQEGEMAVFQTEHLHLTHGIAIEGTVEEWCEVIAGPFARNSNVILSVGVALSGPLIKFVGVAGLLHIFCDSKFGKSLASAIGQSVHGRPLIPNETGADPFGMSWLATANSIGRLVLVRSCIGAFFEELNQGKPQDIADAAYRVANGIDKTRMSGRENEPRLVFCVPGFSTGEEPMVDFLERNGQRVTDGMRTRFADIPADVRPGSVFETFDAEAIPGLGKKFYPLLGKLYGAVGDEWRQVLVDLGPEEITVRASHHQEAFRSRPRVQAIYKVARQYQRSVIDRFASVAAALRMAIEVELLPWNIEDTDAGIESCLVRWADHDKLNPIVVALLRFMEERGPWEGTASQLLKELSRLSKSIVDSPESLGRWLKNSENLKRLEVAGIKIAQVRAKSRDRTKLIRIEKVEVE